MKPIHIGTSSLTNRIFAGTLLKCGKVWSTNKQDVTGEVCGAVIEHVLANKEPVIVNLNGVPTYKLIVERIPTSES